MGWKWGCQPFSFPCPQNVKHCRKEIYSTCLFKTSIPAVPFWNSKHPVSTRSRFLRATVRSTSSALCSHHAHPFVVSAEKRTRFMQRGKAFCQAVVVSKIVFKYSHCALSCAIRLLQTNEHLSRLSFATVGWKRGCQPFSCPCSQNVTHCRKQMCSTCLCKTSIPAVPFWNSKHPPREAEHYLFVGS